MNIVESVNQPVTDAEKPHLNSFEDTSIFDSIVEPRTLRSVIENDIYLLGGQFAILCQFANPSLAKGSYHHSNFELRIYQRLRNTARFINAAIYGTSQEKKAIFSVIHKYHSQVKGSDYYADDPELHKWTAATLFVAVVVVRETFFGKLSKDEMETLFKESAVFGTSLRMPPEMWPATIDDFWAYWNHNIATLEITDLARKMSRDLLHPKKGIPLWMTMASPFARTLTVNWLPERLATEYGLQSSAISRGMFHTIVFSMKVIYPIVPKAIKQRQHGLYMKDLRQAVDRVVKSGHWGSF